jgi:hypothetical protein
VSKLRWAKWYFADWSNDTALRLCSIAARGLWMELLCIAAQGDPYGCVTIKGRPPSEAELRSLVRNPVDDQHRHFARDFRRWLAELERHGVFQWVDIVPVDAPMARPCRAICAPRMRHDGAIAMARSAASRQRWKVTERSQSSLDLDMQTPGNGSALHIQNQNLHTTESRSRVQNTEVRGRPLTNPKERTPPNLPASGEAFVVSMSRRKGKPG